MHSKAVLTLAMALTTLANAAIVGALINVDNPSAIELPTTPQNDITARAAGRVFLARRETDPLACDGYCGDKMHCCLISGLYPRCHTIYTPCSKASYPDGLSAAVPNPFAPTATMVISSYTAAESATTTETLTRPTTTVTRTVLPASTSGNVHVNVQMATPLETPTRPNQRIVTETTVQTISVTSTTVVPITLSTVPVPSSLHANTTSAEPSSLSSSNSSLLTSSSSSPTNSMGTTPPTSPPAPETVHKSTMFSTATVATTTSTSTATLNGEPSAIASTLGVNDADGLFNGGHGGSGRARVRGVMFVVAMVGVFGGML